jgi:uncharacterized protein
MTVEISPGGLTCNLGCRYCYQSSQRRVHDPRKGCDLERIKAAAGREGRSFVLFGGEPLLVPEPVLEDLWAWGLQRFGSNGIQTNGTLVNDNHVRMFKQYKVLVGISIDGPGELNDLRWAGSLEATRAATRRSEDVIERLVREHIPASLIVTLHRANASESRLPMMNVWFRRLDRLGISNVRLHILESENSAVRERFGLSSEENIRAFLNFARLEEELKTLRFDVFGDIRRLLAGKDREATCVWSACDPYTTQSVHGVEAMGQRSNCGRANKEGINFVKSPRTRFERYIALYHTPQQDGGCQGCRFFLMCKGECPGTAIDGDWRNKTEHCEVWKELFTHFEAAMQSEDSEPVSRSPRRPEIERRFLRAWSNGKAVTLEETLAGPQFAGAAESSQTAASEFSAAGLPFKLPEFHRTIWVNDEAQAVWEERIARIAKACSEIEWLLVGIGERRCALQFLPLDELAAYARKFSSHGLKVAPVLLQSGWGWNNSRDPTVVRVAVGRRRDLREFADAWRRRDDTVMGTLLGYPACCRGFFLRTYVHQRMTDLTWAAASETAGAGAGNETVEIKGQPLLNLLWNTVGVRSVPHLACRFDCEPSLRFARTFAKVGRESGFQAEMAWMEEVLSWPAEWSALHGIAEIKTPILKFITTTGATAKRRVIRVRGSCYPREGARGISFPYDCEYGN